MENVSAAIVAIERAALDRWGKGDPGGYLETYAPEITYFDPVSARRVDGLDGMRAWYAPITGKIKVARYDMIDARVQYYDEIAVLSYQLISFGEKKADGTEIVLARWNSTAVYRGSEAGWRIVHSHFSYTQPELRRPVSE
jgi:ketosteroid isomerase-like protein